MAEPIPDPHPWYAGGCDALGPDGSCAECGKVGQTTAEAELIPAVKVGQVWRQRKIGGMWRTVIAIHPAGVEWTANPDTHEMYRWENSDRWVRDAEAEIAIDVG